MCTFHPSVEKVHLSLLYFKCLLLQPGAPELTETLGRKAVESEKWI